MKFCNRCQQIKPLSEFLKRSDRPNSARSICKPCWTITTRVGMLKDNPTLLERAATYIRKATEQEI